MFLRQWLAVILPAALYLAAKSSPIPSLLFRLVFCVSPRPSAARAGLQRTLSSREQIYLLVAIPIKAGRMEHPQLGIAAAFALVNWGDFSRERTSLCSASVASMYQTSLKSAPNSPLLR